jgi:hypothetical protein
VSDRRTVCRKGGPADKTSWQGLASATLFLLSFLFLFSQQFADKLQLHLIDHVIRGCEEVACESSRYCSGHRCLSLVVKVITSMCVALTYIAGCCSVVDVVPQHPSTNINFITIFCNDFFVRPING